MPVLIALTLAWAAGLWLAQQLNQPWWAWGLWAALAGGSWLALRHDPRWRLALACLVAVGLGALRYEAARPPWGRADFLPTYNDQGDVTVEGVVVDTPATRETRTDLRLQAERLYLPGTAEPLVVQGVVIVYAPRFSSSRLTATGTADFEYGDRLAVTGALATPPVFDGFDFRAYLARSGAHSVLPARQISFLAARQADPFSQALFGFRAQALATVRRLFPQPHAELLAGILLGIESGIPPDVAEAFAATGTSHLIAISGFNIALLAGVVSALAFRLWGRWRGTLGTVVVLGLYTLLVGAGGSVVRAAIMGSLALVAHQFGRRTVALNTLAAATLLMTAWNPHWLWDAGFQLSALATLGLVVYGTPWQARVQQTLGRVTTAARARRLAGLVAEVILLTAAAQLTTLPLTLLYFQRFSLSALPVNFLVLPAQPLLMLTSGLALLLGLAWLPLGQLAAWLAWPWSAYTLGVIELAAAMPGASFYLGEVTPAVTVALYALLFGATWALGRAAAQRPAWWRDQVLPRLPAGGLVVAFSATVLLWSYYFSLPADSGRLRVSVLDVGEGEAVLIRAPSGTNVLVGGGAGGRTLSRALSQHLPLGTTVIHLLVIARPDEDHLGALPEVLSRYSIQQAVVTGAQGRGAAYRVTLDRLYAEPSVEIIEAGDRPAFDLGDGVNLRVLADGAEGSTLRLEWDRFALVLPVGLDAGSAQDLARRGLAQTATALLLGPDDATTPEWLAALDPRLVLISTEAGSGYPNMATLERLAGRSVLRTDVNGTVTVETDGVQMWLTAER